LSRPRGDWLSVVDEVTGRVDIGPRSPASFAAVGVLSSQMGRPNVRLATCEGSSDVFAAVGFSTQLSLNGVALAGDGGSDQLLAFRLRADGGLAWVSPLDVPGRASLFEVALDCGRLFVSGNCMGSVDAGVCTGESAGTGNPFVMSLMP